jgi:hypothetical protein
MELTFEIPGFAGVNRVIEAEIENNEFLEKLLEQDKAWKFKMPMAQPEVL